MEDVILNKIESIKRCISRIKEDYDSDFDTNFTKQDAVVLNIERLCQISMDIGSHYIRIYDLGIPKTSRDIFSILENKQVIDSELSLKLKNMVNFRNIAVHRYTELDLEIVKSVINKHLDDFLIFAKQILEKCN